MINYWIVYNKRRRVYEIYKRTPGLTYGEPLMIKQLNEQEVNDLIKMIVEPY